MTEILAIVVTYNRSEKLKACLQSLSAQTNKAFDVLVVDNASTDGTKEYLQTRSDLLVLSEEKNVGGAGGFYDGMRYGTEHGYKYLWLMDDDVLPQEDALERLLVADGNLNGTYGFLSSLALFTDGTPAVMNNHLLKSKISTDSLTHRNGETYVEVLSATFVSFFIKTGTVKTFGFPLKEMFLWSDDTEYSTRITKKEKGYFVPQSVVVHAMDKNEKPDLVTLSYDRLPRMVLNVRNRYYIARRDGFKKKLRFYARHTILFFRVLCKAKDHRIKRLNVLFKGTIKGWLFRPKSQKNK